MRALNKDILNGQRVKVSISNVDYQGRPFEFEYAGMFLLKVRDEDDIENCHVSLISQDDLLELVDGLNKYVEELTEG
jgi:hypothetical protein